MLFLVEEMMLSFHTRAVMSVVHSKINYTQNVSLNPNQGLDEGRLGRNFNGPFEKTWFGS